MPTRIKDQVVESFLGPGGVALARTSGVRENCVDTSGHKRAAHSFRIELSALAFRCSAGPDPRPRRGGRIRTARPVVRVMCLARPARSARIHWRVLPVMRVYRERDECRREDGPRGRGGRAYGSGQHHERARVRLAHGYTNCIGLEALCTGPLRAGLFAGKVRRSTGQGRSQHGHGVVAQESGRNPQHVGHPHTDPDAHLPGSFRRRDLVLPLRSS